jgi:hypothetical protein
MKQTYLYLGYPLFQAQWDKYDQENHKAYIYIESEIKGSC